MAKYTDVIEDMTWSYSRVNSFEFCPYKWFLRYILRMHGPEMFFSSYGTFCHKLLEEYLGGQITAQQAYDSYLMDFRKEVKGKAPTQKIFNSYFNHGLEYFASLHSFPYRVLATEQQVEFMIGKYKMTGIIDVSAMDGDDHVIVDHKSHALKPRTFRPKPTKSDEELDQYLRQLYLYSIPIREIYGVYPTKLCFNCFRTGTFIVEPFREEKLGQAKDWFLDSVEQIKETEYFPPVLDYFKCTNLCENNADCEYYQMAFPPKYGRRKR